MKKTVTVKKTSAGLEVDPRDAIELSKRGSDKLEWVSECDELIIDFGTDSNCPFEWTSPNKKGKKVVESGRIKFNCPTDSKPFKYTIRCGDEELDPEVSIRP